MKVNNQARIILAGLALSGCSTYVPAPQTGTQEYRDSMAVLVQVCMPKSREDLKFGMTTIHRRGTRGEMRSEGIIQYVQAGETTSRQRVFEAFTYRRPIDLIATKVLQGQTEFMFDLQEVRIDADGWTAWAVPKSQNQLSEGASFRLMQSGEYTVRAPAQDAPKARYRLIRTGDWWKNMEPHLNDGLPGC